MKKTYQQLGRRQGAGFVRHMLAEYRKGSITTQAGAFELGVNIRWFRKLYGDYLQACAHGGEKEWYPGTLGENRSKSIREEVEEL